MPTALVKWLNAFNSQQLNFLHSRKAGLHHVSNVRSFWCQRVNQQCTAPGTNVGFGLVNFSLSPPTPNGKKATSLFFSLGESFIPPTEYPSLFRMEERGGKGSTEEDLQKGTGDAKVQQEETVKLQKEGPERRKGEQEDARNRVKEQEVEDKIGPPPEKPLPGDCCGQGCVVCVWDTYWEELAEYKKLRKEVEDESGQ